MKKALSMILVLAMCLSLCACGSDKEVSVSETEVVEDTIAVVETEPVIVETEPRFEIVELTLDNWQEYYEFVENPNFQKNAFGDVESFGVGVYLRLKEEYQQCFVSLDNGAIEYQRQFAVIGCEVNMEAETYNLLDTHEIREKVLVSMSTLSTSCSMGEGTYLEEGPTHRDQIAAYAEIYGASGPYNQSIHGYPVNIEITRIQGTLTFSN